MTQAIHLRKIVIRSNGWSYPFEKIVIRRSNDSGYLLEKNVIPSKAARYYSKPLSREPFATNLSKTVSLNGLRNSSKRCLPSPHEFSRYIFCWIAFFSFITFDYRPLQVLFKTKYSTNFSNKLCFDFSYANIKRFWWPWEYTLTVNKLCLFEIPSSPFTISGKKILKAIATAQIWKTKTVPCTFTAAYIML